MKKDEAIKRTSIFLQKVFHDDEDALGLVRVYENKKDADFFIVALEQLISSCEWLKQSIDSQKGM